MYSYNALTVGCLKVERFNVTVIIPSLNPDEKLERTIIDLEKQGFDDILIIDDGSDELHKKYFPDLSVHTSCTIIHHRRNRGKGAALKTAFKYVNRYRETRSGVVTIDADGQHLTEDIIACVNKMCETESVVLGCRDFSEPQVPPKSRFGNKLTHGVLRFLCGLNVSDTQTGLRAIPKKYIAALLEVKGDRYEYETNMLLEFKKQSIPFCEVKISTVYFDDNKGTHFRPIRDSLRVYKFILAFVFSSLIGTAVENIIFYLGLKLIFGDMSNGIFLATAVARVCSATVNFTVNRKAVFASKAGVGITLVKYIALAVPMLLISAYSVTGFALLLHIESEALVTLIKMVIDVLLFLISFRIQQNWVFAIPKGKAAVNTEITFEKKSKKKKLTVGTIIGRAALSFFTLIIYLVATVFILVGVVAYGPSTTMRDMLVLSAMQASATKWVPGIFLSDEEVDRIVNLSYKESVVILDPTTMDTLGGDNDEVGASIDGMKYITANYPNFKAYILLVADPSRLYVGTSSNNYSAAKQGKRIFEMVEQENCIAMINGGEFADAGGNGTGATPLGLTYSKGKCVWNDGARRTFIGIDNNNRLVVSESMTKSKADELGIRDGVSFKTGNVLIDNDEKGVHVYYKESNTGTAQRTAIGQREDGTFILVVTDGRSANSIGATYNDIIDIMVSYGAVNAGMLDGGSSAMMYYENYYDKYDVGKESLDKYQLQGLTNKYKAFVPPRRIPTYFCITR